MLFVWQVTTAQDTVSIMYYNVLNYPGSTPERVNYFRTISQYTLPDVLLITEILNEDGANDLLNLGLNSGETNFYQSAQFMDGPDTDNMLYFNSEKFGLKEQNVIPTALRDINEYVLFKKPISGPDSIFVHFFIAHLKASTGSSNEQKRLLEVMQLGQYLEDNGIDENYIFGGDLNFYDSDEPAYQYIISDTGLSMVDPLPAGDWHDDAAFADIHTQSTRTAQFGGGASGGCDDRFDFIFFSENLVYNDDFVQYLNGSTYAFANDGQHFNKSILDSPLNTTVPDSVLQALYYMADHLPVISSLIYKNEPAYTAIDAKVFLEGAFNGIHMNAYPVNDLPDDQPYNKTPWFYDGMENIESGSDNIVDWCLLEIRVSDGSVLEAIADTAVWKQACLILNDGSIRDTNLVGLPQFEDKYAGDKYLVVRHRNHLDIISSAPLQVVNNMLTVDFTTSPSNVYGGENGYSQVSNGSWGMAAGDLNGDGLINFVDIQNIWKLQAGMQGYLDGDLNLNEQVNNKDKNQFCIPNLNKFTSIPQ